MEKISNGCGIDLIVAGVCSDEANKNNASVVMDMNNEAVSVALKVKNDAISRKNVSRAITSFDIGEGFPAGGLGLVEPSFERLFRIGVLFPEVLERPARYDTHVFLLIVPKMGTESSP